jgi:hypothetical protein
MVSPMLIRGGRSNSLAFGFGQMHPIPLNTHNLERVDTSLFVCNSVNISIADKDLGMVITVTDGHGHRKVQEVH